jgi:hypothetical protein
MLRESVARIAGVGALAALAIAVWFSIVLARADSYFRASTPETVQRAVEIAPWNTEYLALRALQLDYDGADSTALTEKIARLNPYASAPRIRLGLAREVSGDFVNSERWLLEAAEVDHQFEPRWTLANFYFRANKREPFFAWMRAALDVSYGDRTPAFDLCWRVSADAAEILQRAIPDRHEVIGSYLIYLSQTKRLEAILPVARRLAGYHDASDLPLLFGACDEIIEARDPAAIEVWRLAGQSAPSGIFNGDFATTPLNHGFDWRVRESPGVTHVELNAPAGHRIVFNGQQPESCSLLEQKLILVGGRRYRMQWEARTAGIKSPSGLEWRIGDQRAALAPSEDWKPGEMMFTAHGPFDGLELAYGRPMGESRAEGNVELRHIRLLEVAP